MSTLERCTILAIILCCAVAMVSQSLNYGIGLPTNGPCVAFPKSAGVCSDNGVPSMYGIDGVIVHLPARGDKGDQGDPGQNGVDGQNGKDGAQGPQGLPGKDAVFPQTITLTCPPGTGTVAKGFTIKNCTVSQ
jgi:hypothetical protein